VYTKAVAVKTLVVDFQHLAISLGPGLFSPLLLLFFPILLTLFPLFKKGGWGVVDGKGGRGRGLGYLGNIKRVAEHEQSSSHQTLLTPSL
jgi:hypothetical protein